MDLCLAVIEQESGGTEPDIMQTAQSYYNVNPPIDSAEESIDCGTHELSDCLTKAKCQSPNDIKGISLAKLNDMTDKEFAEMVFVVTEWK